MARIPVYDGPQAETAPLPGVRQQIAAPDAAFGSVQAQQLQQLGNLGQKVALQAKQAADQTRVDDALNQLRESETDLTYGESGYTSLRGVQALDRPDKKPLSSEYFEKLQQRQAEIMQGLGNDSQRIAFQQRSNDRLTAFRGSLMNYEGEQFQRYQLSVAEGTVASASQQVAQFYNDPAKIDDGVLSIRSAVVKSGRLQGLSAEQIQVNSDKLVSAAHASAIAQAMGSGPTGVLQAEQYLRTYKDQMTPADLLKARGVVDEHASKVIGEMVAGSVLKDLVSAAHPDDMSRVLSITQQSESGGRRYGLDGKTLLTSPKGAKGEMQVLDSTNLNPGFGVTPARNESPEERARVGRDYMSAMVKRYDGNLPLAWAAYNAGPGALDDALAAAKKDGNPNNWLQNLPRETQEYVTKNTASYQRGAGPAPIDYAAGRQRIAENPELLSRPMAMQKALASYDKQYGDYRQAQKASQDEAFEQALGALQGGTPYNQLPRVLLDKVAPSDRERLEKHDNKTNLTVYQFLASNPAQVRAMSDADFNKLQADLSPADFKKFADFRGSKDGKAGEKGAPGTLDMTGISQVLKQRFASMEIDPKGDPRAGAIAKHVQDRILVEQARIGRQLTDAEQIRFIDEQFLRTRAFRPGGWFSHGDVRQEQLLAMQVDDIPPASERAIRSDLARKGINDPTDQHLLEAYFRMDAANPNR